MDKSQSVVTFVVSTAAAILQPIEGPIIAFAIVAIINIIIGWITAVNFKGEKFQIRKFVDALFQVLAVLLTITCIYIVSHLQGDPDQGKIATSMLVYASCFMYGQNILKNLCFIWPENQFFQLLYFVLSAKWLCIVKKAQSMKAMDNIDNTENSKNTTLS